MKRFLVTLVYRGLLEVEVLVSAANRKEARSQAVNIAKANAFQIHSPESSGGAFNSIRFTRIPAFRREHITSVRMVTQQT